MSQHTLVTVQELADMLQLLVATIWRYTRTEQILYVQLLNRQYCYDIEKVMDHLADRVWTYEDYLRLPDEERYYYEVFGGCRFRTTGQSILKTKSCEAHALKDNAYVLRSSGLDTGESTHPGLASDLAALWGRRVFSVSPEESLSDSSACIVRSSDFGRPIRLRYFLRVKRADPVQSLYAKRK